MFNRSVWARLLLPITDGRTYGRLSWALYFLANLLFCNRDKISGLIYWSINPQIYTVSKLRSRSEGAVVTRKKLTGLWKMEYSNCHGITYLRTTKAIRGKLKPRTAKDEEWSIRIWAIGRTLNITSSIMMAHYEGRSRLLDQLCCANYPKKSHELWRRRIWNINAVKRSGLACFFPWEVSASKKYSYNVCDYIASFASGNQELTFPSK